MILYNTIVGLAAGAGLLGVAQLLKQFANGEKVQPEGFVFDLWHDRIYSDRPWPNDFCDVALHEGPCFRLVLKITINKA